VAHRAIFVGGLTDKPGNDMTTCPVDVGDVLSFTVHSIRPEV